VTPQPDGRVHTERLVLRRWRDGDRDAFFALNSDPVVMATIGPVMDRTQSDAFLDRIETAFDERGFGLWCVDLHGESIGFTGLSVPWFRDGVEVGWRIRSSFWGRGYAPEAARAALRVAFDDVGLDEVISFTAVINHRSRRVMEKIGLTRDLAGDFDHPSVPDGNALRPHVLYRVTAEQYRSTT
jgi:RimJ/RimL family protein N-acetyltransferase